MALQFDGSPRPVGSYPDSGIHVIVVGTGLAGLSAAIECTRKGHSVTVLERHHEINTMGDMYFMGLSATRFFKHWPDMSAEYDDISLHKCWMETFKHSGELMIPVLRVAERLKEAGLDPNTPPGTFQMRPLIYRMFVRQAKRLRIDIRFGRRVVAYAEDAARGKANVETDSGERLEADLVVAADGIGSKSQEIVGGQVRAASSGRAMWRAAFPVEVLDKNAKVKAFFGLKDGTDPIVRTFLGPGSYGLTLTRHDVMVWIVNHDASPSTAVGLFFCRALLTPAQATGNERESWEHTVEADNVLANMDKSIVGPGPGWAAIFKDLIRLTPPKTIVNFELFWRNPQPCWCSPGARVVQIGDCAHSFLPSSGNGATQAIEDAVSLASCLQLGGGPEAVPTAVKAHIRFRFLRCACAQKLGFSNAERLQDTDWKKAKLDPRKAQPKHPRWVWNHDPEAYAYENFERCVEGVKRGVPVDQNPGIPPNYPPGYKYVPWSIDEIMKDLDKGKAVELGDGNWD